MGIGQLHPSPPLAGCFSIRINVITSQARKRNRLLAVKNPEKSLSWEARYPSAIVIEPGNRRRWSQMIRNMRERKNNQNCEFYAALRNSVS